MAFQPHRARSIKELAHYLEVCSKNGYHCSFKYGWPFANDAAYIYDLLRKPVYHGWTFRVFFYAVNTDVGSSHVQITLDGIKGSPNTITTEVQNNSVVTYGKAQGIDFKDKFADSVKQGDYFSLGVEIDGDVSNFKGVFNDDRKDTHRMENVKDLGRWLYKITASTNVLTSLHIYDDLGTNFPRDGLGPFFILNTIPFPTGSFGLFSVRLTRDWKVISFTVGDPQGTYQQSSQIGSLQAGTVLVIYIRITPIGWILHDNLQGNEKIVGRGYPGLNIMLSSPNADVVRIYMESSI